MEAMPQERFTQDSVPPDLSTNHIVRYVCGDGGGGKAYVKIILVVSPEWLVVFRVGLFAYFCF